MKNLEDEFIEFMKDCSNPVNKEVSHPDEELVMCDWNSCKVRGEYVRCYFDLFKICPQYITHKNYLKTVREMKANKRFKRRNYRKGGKDER